MRLKKVELAAKLGVSERILTTWQREGMPVLEHGRRGQENVYDLAAIVRWIKQTSRGLTPKAGRPPIDLDALERELGVAPAPGLHVCTGADSRAIARALALGRVEWFEQASDWDFETSPQEMAELFDLFIYHIGQQLAAAGLPDVQKILESLEREAAWPEDIGEIIARCRAEVPT